MMTDGVAYSIHNNVISLLVSFDRSTVSSINKINHHYISERLLKVTLSTIILALKTLTC